MDATVMAILLGCAAVLAVALAIPRLRITIDELFEALW
jgi:hypothetical protein